MVLKWSRRAQNGLGVPGGFGNIRKGLGRVRVSGVSRSVRENRRGSLKVLEGLGRSERAQ